jgi:SSS family solute:Na+ symporter
VDVAIVVAYLAAMIAFGFWGKRRATTESDFLVAGRRLGPLLYAGTLSALVLGGASTIGGVGLGYEYGLSGMWLVVAIGTGVLLLSLLFAGRIQRLRVYTVSQMLQLRYGPGSSVLSGVVMFGYTLMLTVTSTIAYATIFAALLDLPRVPSILVGGLVVVIYSALGGMWSITLTDFVQFLIQTVGIFLILLPVVLVRAGGFEAVPPEALSPTTIGGDTILTYFVIYTFGLLIGQDIWQRVFTARSPGVARWAGAAAGVYCLLYGVAGALVGMGASVLVPGLEEPGDAFTAVVGATMTPVLAGLVLAAALAAVMSTASGSLIATATVFGQDIVRRLRGRTDGSDGADGSEAEHVRGHRLLVAAFGVVAIVIACLLQDVVAALTIAYDILVGGLLVPILGGLMWRRATIVGAVGAMAAGTVATLVTMAVVGDIEANEPIYVGLAAGLVVFVVGSLASRPTAPEVLAEWDRRSSGAAAEAPVA